MYEMRFSKRIVCAFLFSIVLCQFSLQAQTVSTISESFNVPGAPQGEVTSGVLMRPQGKKQIQMIMIDPRVTRVRIEQADYSVPLTGPNPNQLFYDDNPLQSMQTVFDISVAGNVRFTVWVRGDERIPQAVNFRWIP